MIRKKSMMESCTKSTKKIRLIVDVEFDSNFIDEFELTSIGSTLFYTRYTEGKVVEKVLDEIRKRMRK